MLKYILFVFFEAGFQEALQEFGERDKYPGGFLEKSGSAEMLRKMSNTTRTINSYSRV